MIRVNIKWGQETFQEVPFDPSEPLDKFKALLQDLSGVPAQKQKIIFKGVVLKDGLDLSALKIQNGGTILLNGAKEDIKIDHKNIVFLEDLTADQKAALLKEKAGIILPIGLENLGNTCYLNSSIQILRRVNELNDHITKQDHNDIFYHALRGVFLDLQQKGQSVTPKRFLMVFFSAFPQFMEKDGHGGFKQQDADECFQNILTKIQPQCQIRTGNQDVNLLKHLFEIQFESIIQTPELPDEQPQFQKSTDRKLMCIIDNNNNPVNTLTEGIKASLEEQFTKFSDFDKQEHVYKRVNRISKLPNYLLVQMVRFFWKQGYGTKEGVKAKILRNVAFPKILDLFDFCTPVVQGQLQVGRELEKSRQLEQQSQEKDELELFKKDLEEKGQIIPDDSREIFKKFKERKRQEEIDNHDKSLNRQFGTGKETGNYEVIGVLTHQGREADSGHYVAWVHRSGDDWIQYNDDTVTEVKIDQILDLRGGGDWHMAYYLLYRKLEID
ncbi:hypothetical protein pb186bvf_011640 [Paramecium bursaria]